MGCFNANACRLSDKGKWIMPDEGEPHKRTWMAFGASRKIWGDYLLAEARRNLATIARTIAKYEPVSMLVRKKDFDQGFVFAPKPGFQNTPHLSLGVPIHFDTKKNDQEALYTD
jgi:peptidyl-arginine deiminase